MNTLIHVLPVVAHQNERLVADARRKDSGRNVMEQIFTEFLNSWLGFAVAFIAMIGCFALAGYLIVEMIRENKKR